MPQSTAKTAVHPNRRQVEQPATTEMNRERIPQIPICRHCICLRICQNCRYQSRRCIDISPVFLEFCGSMFSPLCFSNFAGRRVFSSFEGRRVRPYFSQVCRVGVFSSFEGRCCHPYFSQVLQVDVLSSFEGRRSLIYFFSNFAARRPGAYFLHVVRVGVPALHMRALYIGDLHMGDLHMVGMMK